MEYIDAKLLGSLNLSCNGQSLTFPYNKAQALFLYLLIHKRVTRDAAANLLWSSKSDEKARKNLRNAIYSIKQQTRPDIFLHHNNTVIEFNPAIGIRTDVDVFLREDGSINEYEGEFLREFVIKDCGNFENWMLATRQSLRETYLSKVKRLLDAEKQRRNYPKAVAYAKMLIREDEYNEEAYRDLIEGFYRQGKISDAVEAYDEIAAKLQKELNIAPDESIEHLFAEVCAKLHERKAAEKPEHFFYGRYDELDFLANTYRSFAASDRKAAALTAPRSVLIKGEMGIGKTRLKEEFKKLADPSEVLLLEVNCYEFEMENPLKPWRNMIFKLCSTIKSDSLDLPQIWLYILNHLVPEVNQAADGQTHLNSIGLLKLEVVSELIDSLTRGDSFRQKIVLVFEDIQWMDADSLSVLTRMLLDLSAEKFLFLLTCRDGDYAEVEQFETRTRRYGKLHLLELRRFDIKEVECFMRKASGHYVLDRQNIEQIYKETEGNPFFLTECLDLLKSNQNINLMTMKMRDVLKSRFIGIAPDGMQALEIASLFNTEVPMHILEQLLRKERLGLLNVIEPLEKKQILQEQLHNGQIFFKFTHQKLREFIYLELSPGKRRLLHNEVGSVLEQTIDPQRPDTNLYYSLIHHFAQAQNIVKLSRYKIRLLDMQLSFHHELFPILGCSKAVQPPMSVNDRDTQQRLKEIAGLLHTLQDGNTDPLEYSSLEMAYLRMKGRYCIRIGDYDNGLGYIGRMMMRSMKQGNHSFYTLEGYKQLLYYCIQTNNADDMEKYANEGLEAALKGGDYRETAVLLRLKALSEKMAGRYAEAETLLQESIRSLSLNPQEDQYALSIAAAYSYMGDIRKLQGKYKESLPFYEQAIQICEDKNVMTSLAFISVNAGESAYHISMPELAKQYLETALTIYKHFNIMWGKSIAESLMSLIRVREGNYEEALDYLRRSERSAQSLGNPREIGVVYKTMAEIRARIGDELRHCTRLRKYLSNGTEYYAQQAINYLNISNDASQVAKLTQLLAVNSYPG